MTEKSNYNTPYDDVFRTLLNDCPKFMIPVVNEAFGEKHSENEEVVLYNNEHYLEQEGDGLDKRITDSNFSIGDKRYQIECQSSDDGSMMVRVWEYGSQIALENAEFDEENHVLRLKFPNTAIMYLRHKKDTPDYTNIEVVFPGTVCRYQVPNIKVDEYSIDEIFEKKLYFFLPFHLFSYEKNFSSYDEDEKQLQALTGMYINILGRLKNSELGEFQKQTIWNMSKIIMENLARKYKNVRKGLGDVMGGKVLDYEAKQIRNEGRAEGEKKLIRLMSCIKADYGEKSDDIITDILVNDDVRNDYYNHYGIK